MPATAQKPNVTPYKTPSLALIHARFEERERMRLLGNRAIPNFGAGDTLRVHVTLRGDGTKERIQAFEGVCIARNKKEGYRASFTVRRITMGVEVLRSFWLYSPLISIEVVRQGRVRRAKLYYLRALMGKKARIAERTSYAPKGKGKHAKASEVEGQAPTQEASDIADEMMVESFPELER